VIFLKRAGTVILALSILLWFLCNFPHAAEDPSDRLAQSFAGQIGHALEPVLQPLGFDWRIGIGLVASLAAREVFVSTMSIVYHVGGEEEGVVEAMRAATWPDGTLDLHAAHLPGAVGVLCLRAPVPEHGGRGPAGNRELEVAGLHDGLHGGVGVRRRLVGAGPWARWFWGKMDADWQLWAVGSAAAFALGYLVWKIFRGPVAGGAGPVPEKLQGR
jgi:hypothetical protein